MGLYDDGGVEFAQQQFDSARERGIEQAKKAQKEGRRQELIDTFITKPVLSGIQSSITQSFADKGQALQDANIPQKTYLTNFLNQYNGRNAALEYSKDNTNGFIVNGVVDEDKLSANISSYMRDAFASTQEFQNLNVKQFSAFINNAANKEAIRLKDYYQNMYDEGLDLPDNETILSDFDKWNSRENPTDPFGRIFKGVKRVFGRETEETITFNRDKASESLRVSLGEDTTLQLTELKNAVDAFDAKATESGSRYGIDDLIIEAKKSIKNGEITGSIVEGSTEIVKVAVERNGIKGEDQVLRGRYYNPVNGLEELYIGGSLFVKTGVVERKNLETAEKERGWSALEAILNNPNAVKEFEEEYIQVIGQGKKQNETGNLESYYGDMVAFTSRHIFEKYPELANQIDDSRIDNIAAHYIMGQVELGFGYSQLSNEEKKAKNLTTAYINELIENPDTSPTLFMLLKENAKFTLTQKNGDNLILQNLVTVAEDLTVNNPSQLPELKIFVRDVMLERTRGVKNGEIDMSSVLPGNEQFFNDLGLEGTYEEQVIQYELQFYKQQFQNLPENLRELPDYIKPFADDEGNYNGSLSATPTPTPTGTSTPTPTTTEEVDEVEEEEEVVEEVQEESILTSTPAPAPVSTPSSSKDEATNPFVAGFRAFAENMSNNKRLDQIQKTKTAIERAEKNGERILLMGDLREYVEEKTGIEFISSNSKNKNYVSNERIIELAKEYQQMLENS